MKIGQQLRFIFINKTAESLYSLIADGKYRATSLGRRLSVRKPPCSKTATRKGSMLKVVPQKQESASLLTRKMTASLAILESGLVQEEIIRAEM